jgi:hypothetical protein
MPAGNFISGPSVAYGKTSRAGSIAGVARDGIGVVGIVAYAFFGADLGAGAGEGALSGS